LRSNISEMAKRDQPVGMPERLFSQAGTTLLAGGSDSFGKWERTPITFGAFCLKSPNSPENATITYVATVPQPLSIHFKSAVFILKMCKMFGS